MTVTASPARDTAALRKARRAVEAIDALAHNHDLVGTTDHTEALRTLRRWLADPDTPGHNDLWNAVGAITALTLGRPHPETFTTSRPMIAELLDMRITAAQRPPAVDVDAVFANLVD